MFLPLLPGELARRLKNALSTVNYQGCETSSTVDEPNNSIRQRLWPGSWQIAVLLTIFILAGSGLYGRTGDVMIRSGPTKTRYSAVHLPAPPQQQHQQHAVWDLQLLESLQHVLAQATSSIGKQYANCPVCGGSETTALRLLQQYIRINAVTGKLAEHLTSTYQNKTQLTMAVTGGSSSAINPGWHGMLVEKLKPLPLHKVELRNAAQGATSQLVTAPCLRTLVGDNVDLLFWEFAMNDEFPMVAAQPTSGRVRLAETWIRSAARLKPKALGFVHFYDLLIHNWDIGQQQPPDRAWVPTNYAADEVLRGQGIDAYSVNMLGIFSSGLITATNKGAFLRDVHHPNDMALNVTADVLKLGMLMLWQQGLEIMSGKREAQPRQQSPQPLLQQGLLVPALHQASACYLTSTPQFGMAEPVMSLLGCADDVPTQQGNGCVLVPFGKAASNRNDRKAMLKLPLCNDTDDTIGLSFGINTTQPLTGVWLSCGLEHACRNLNVFLDGSKVQSNVNVNGDMLSYFFSWVINVTSTSFERAKALRICNDNSTGTSEHTSMSRVLLWMQDNGP